MSKLFYGLLTSGSAFAAVIVAAFFRDHFVGTFAQRQSKHKTLSRKTLA
jgi:hypothetical protein